MTDTINTDPVRITRPETPRQLRAALSARGLSQQRLAKLIGVDPRTTRRWCDERAGPDRQLGLGPVALIAAALASFDESLKADQDPATS